MRGNWIVLCIVAALWASSVPPGFASEPAATSELPLALTTLSNGPSRVLTAEEASQVRGQWKWFYMRLDLLHSLDSYRGVNRYESYLHLYLTPNTSTLVGR